MSDQKPFEPIDQPAAPADQTLLPTPPPAGYETPPPPAGAYGTPPPGAFGAPPYGGYSMPPAWAPAPPPQPRDTFWSRIAAYVALIAVIAGALGAFAGFSLARNLSPLQVGRSSGDAESPIQAQLPSGASNGGTLNVAAIATKVNPAIVDINTVLGNGQAAGTGMIISSSGEVLTNNHVVTGSTSISVTIQGRSQPYTASVVGVDVSKDVAVIQVHGVSGLPHVTFAKSSSIKVGDPVVAIGNALGQGGTPNATQGTVTDLDQTITASEGGGRSETLSGMIQSDAIIYEGDSGGALVNSSAQVVGMITAGQTQGFRSSASTVGYAIPADAALAIANRIRAGEKASDLTYGQVGFMGVSVQNLDSASAAQLGLSILSGALVISVQPGSPADNAGIARYDVITNLGGTSIDTSDTLGTAIKSHQPGDQVSVTWVDQSGTHHGTVTLGGVNP